MPQNAIIRANGTGDYTTIIAWEAAEQSSNYGSITVGRVDGFFDQGGTALIITGGFAAFGARLEPFDSADGFDGTERQLCGLTSSQAQRTIRCRQSITVELEGLEVYNTGNSTAGVIQSDNFGPVTANNTLIKTGNDKIHQNVILTNSVLVSTDAASTVDPITATNNATNSTFFFASTDALGQGSTNTLTNTVVVNAGSGGDIDAGITQNNNASTDTTADTLINIVIAMEFVDATPVVSGDYRIAAGSDLDTNNIGAFIQVSGGVSIPVIMNQLRNQGIQQCG